MDGINLRAIKIFLFIIIGFLAAMFIFSGEIKKTMNDENKAVIKQGSNKKEAENLQQANNIETDQKEFGADDEVWDDNIVNKQDIPSLKDNSRLDTTNVEPAPREYYKQDTINNKQDYSKYKQNKENISAKPQQQKSPMETYNFALLEMNKQRYNSAIFEFNNAIDTLGNYDLILKARRNLAYCYEKKGIDTEAFDIYEYIYIETGKKLDLLNLSRVAKRLDRIDDIKGHMQTFIETNPEELDLFIEYMT